MGKVADRLRMGGWRQGDLLRPECTASLIASCIDLAPESEKEKMRLVLLSQDCDIVKDEAVEPYIELIAAREIPECDSLDQGGRNPRLLHLPYRGRGLEISIHDRFRVWKDGFVVAAERETEAPLDNAGKDQIIRWVSRRYLRAAFPDAFNIRLEKANKVLKKFEKSEVAKKISVILFRTDEREYQDGEAYQLDVIVGVQNGLSFDVKDLIEKELLKAIRVRGIDINNVWIRTEDDITYRDLRTYKRWDRDYRSLPERDGVAIPFAEIDSV